MNRKDAPMVTVFEIMPVLALAMMIVLVPVIADKPSIDEREKDER